MITFVLTVFVSLITGMVVFINCKLNKEINLINKILVTLLAITLIKVFPPIITITVFVSVIFGALAAIPKRW